MFTNSKTLLDKIDQEFDQQKLVYLTADFRITIKKSIEILQNKIQLKKNQGHSYKYDLTILEYLQDMIDYENYQYYKDSD